MWCVCTPIVHVSAAVVFFQSASVSSSRRAVASAAFASTCLANASPPASMMSSLVCLSQYKRTVGLRIDRSGDVPRAPQYLGKLPEDAVARRGGQREGTSQLQP